jgi:hypothetical protein
MRHILTFTLCAAAFLISSTASVRAANLAWYRMGDDDASPVVGASIAQDPGGISNHLTGTSWGILRGRPKDEDGGGRPLYSDVVPSAQIYNPVDQLTYPNEWSFKTTSVTDSQGSKGNYKWDSQFTLETFIYFDVAGMSSVRGMQFINHQTSTNGGWRFIVENAAGTTRDTIRAEFYTLNNLTIPINVNTTTQMVPQTWYHLGVIYKQNEDSSHTVELYLNHALESTGAIPAGSEFGTGTFQVYLGHIQGGLSSGRSITMDEFRYFDTALTSASFLQAVQPVSGDFDGDGDVDGADFITWQTNFPTNENATLAQGDADEDGDVDGADFAAWQSQFPAGPGPGVAPVPEPWSLMTALLGVIMWPFVSRSRRSLHVGK